MKVVHEWLKEYTGPTIPSVAAIQELLMFHAFEIEGAEQVAGHEVIELKILPDRAAYCLSHRGIAREIASITGVPLAFDPLQSEERLPLFEDISVDIEDDHACTRFAAALMTGIAVKDSPVWLQDRLRALGQRPINNIVDATNYVMYAIGQPLHAYDAEKFPQHEGKWQFQVRFAKKGEEVSLIAEGGKNEERIIELEGTEQLIVDKSAHRPIGLAGVKGGAYAEVDAATTSIIIEAAHFDPIVTRKTSRRLGIVIDGSKRFENDPAEGLVPHALREVVQLIIQIAGGDCVGSIDAYKTPQVRPQVPVSFERVNALLGLELPPIKILEILGNIGATVVPDDQTHIVTGPWERNDLNIEEDFIEEIGRIYGYEHIVAVVPQPVPLAQINPRHFYSEEIRKILIGLGYSEVITSSFVKKDQVELRNALASDKSYVRSNLRKNIEVVLEKNANLVDLLGARDTRVFEIGTVFQKMDGCINEHVSLCLGVRSKMQGFVPADDALLETTAQELSEALGTPVLFAVEKGIAEIDLSAVIASLPEPSHYKEVEKSADVLYKPFSAYPSMSRDIALWVTQGIDPTDVEKVLNELAGDLRVRTTLVDVFTKEGKTSYAFRLVFQSDTQTLTDGEVNAIMERVYDGVSKKGWEVR